MITAETQRHRQPINHTNHDHLHQGHDHAHHRQPSRPTISKFLKRIIVGGNLGISAAEALTAGSTSALWVDAAHNLGDAYVYNEQINNIHEPNSPKAKSFKRRKGLYTILAAGSAIAAAKSGTDLVIDHEALPDPWAVYTAAASVLFNSGIGIARLRSMRKHKKEGGQHNHHDHDVNKHLLVDSASAGLAFTGALAGSTVIGPLAGITSGALGTKLFFPSEKNLRHSFHAHGEEDNNTSIISQQTQENIPDHIDRELHITLTMNDSRARILTAMTTQNPNRFHPHNVDPLNEREKEKLLHATHEHLDYQAAETISRESRQATNISFETWHTNMEAWITKKTDTVDADQSDRIAAFKAVGIIDEGDHHQNHIHYTPTIQRFYDRYLKNKSDIKSFVNDFAESCKDQNGIINLTLLHRRLMAVEPLLVTFGKENNVNLLVRDFTLTHGMLAQPEHTKPNLVEEVARRATTIISPDLGEHIYLNALHEVAKRRIRRHSEEDSIYQPQLIFSAA